VKFTKLTFYTGSRILTTDETEVKASYLKRMKSKLLWKYLHTESNRCYFES